MMLSLTHALSGLNPLWQAGGDQSNSYVVYGSVLATLIAMLAWLLERRERQACQRRNEELSLSCRHLTEQHYRERIQAEERHLITFDAYQRNTLESLERALLGKPKS